MSKKRRIKRLDDLKKWRIEMLARCGGFSRRYIAAQVFGSPINRPDKGELSCISGYLKRLGIKLRDWRDGLTVAAQSYAAEVSTPKKVKKYRIPQKRTAKVA
jgi:hypothetical protein